MADIASEIACLSVEPETKSNLTSRNLADIMRQQKSNLIYRNLAEVMGQERIDAKLAQGKDLICYIGFAPTGQIHLGYLVPCMKIRDLTLAGCQMAIMIADVHATLDERKTPSHLVELRSDYYRKMLSFMFNYLGADMSKIKFIRGSEFQLTGNYSMDVWELASRVTITAAKKAGTEVVKQDKHPKLGSAIYPLMQAVDENYVGQATFGAQADIELGGTDQRKIFCFSCEHDENPEEGRISYLMNPIISLAKSGKRSEGSSTGRDSVPLSKMSASDPNGKITFTDSYDTVQLKISKAFCCDKDPDCGVMKLMQTAFFPLNEGKNVITIELDDNTEIHYKEYSQFEKDFKDGVFVAPHLKKTIIDLISEFMHPVRDFINSNEMQSLITEAYPSTN